MRAGLWLPHGGVDDCGGSEAGGCVGTTVSLVLGEGPWWLGLSWESRCRCPSSSSLQVADAEDGGDGDGVAGLLIDPAWWLVSFLSFAKGREFCTSPWDAFPSGFWRRESASLSWNKLLRASLFVVVVRSGIAVGSVSWCSGASLVFFGVVFGVASSGFGVVLWCSAKEVAGGRWAESGEPTADTLSPRIFCGFPKLGVRSLFPIGVVGGLNIRCVAPELGWRWRKLVLRRTTSSASGCLLVISVTFRDLSARKGCNVLELFLI